MPIVLGEGEQVVEVDGAVEVHVAGDDGSQENLAGLEEGRCPTCGRTSPRIVPTTGLSALAAAVTAVLDEDDRLSLWQVELRVVDGEEELIAFLAPAGGTDLLDVLDDLDHRLSVTQFVVLAHHELDERLIDHGDARVVDLR